MNSFDPMAVQALRDAHRMSDLCNEAELIAQQEAEADAQLNKVCAGIRKLDLTPAQVRQILCTLACEMVKANYSAGDVEMIETASEVIA